MLTINYDHFTLGFSEQGLESPHTSLPELPPVAVLNNYDWVMGLGTGARGCAPENFISTEDYTIGYCHALH
eukprot:Pgem_evm1s7794